jgi:curved DNA-binding protein CbpA
VLGLSENAGDRQVREAYLRRVREHPPDRDPETFERIRDAYEAIRDPYRRFTRLIASVDPGAPLATLLDEECVGTRRFVGPGPWLAALKEG